MMGPTGCGKTEIARRLAQLTAAPFVKVEATKFTEVGYHGRDVDTMVRDLLDQAIQMVRREHWRLVRDKAKADAAGASAGCPSPAPVNHAFSHVDDPEQHRAWQTMHDDSGRAIAPWRNWTASSSNCRPPKRAMSAA